MQRQRCNSNKSSPSNRELIERAIRRLIPSFQYSPKLFSLHLEIVSEDTYVHTGLKQDLQGLYKLVGPAL